MKCTIASLTSSSSCIAACSALLLSSAAALAVPQTVTSVDTPHCDPLLPLTVVDELGLAPIFPPDERIDAFASPTTLSACPTMDDPNTPNALIRMVNLTTTSFFNVHYVADPAAAGAAGTTISNEDGLVNGGQAFRIDTVGVNTPLVSESMLPAGIFQPGEFWTFIIQDYVNGAGLSPAAFLSIGVGSASPGGPSSGSIIALVVPEPGSLALAAPAALVLTRRRRHA